MNFFKSIAAAVGAIAISTAPAAAKVDPDTGNLLRLLDASGVNVVVSNHSACHGQGYHGQYRFAGMRRMMVLCPQTDAPTADDHLTVRHETTHAIQHCVNVSRGTPVNAPIGNVQNLAAAVNSSMPARMVEAIKRAYPQDHWLVEFEAFLVSEQLTAAELMEFFRRACLAE